MQNRKTSSGTIRIVWITAAVVGIAAVALLLHGEYELWVALALSAVTLGVVGRTMTSRS